MIKMYKGYIQMINGSNFLEGGRGNPRAPLPFYEILFVNLLSI